MFRALFSGMHVRDRFRTHCEFTEWHCADFGAPSQACGLPLGDDVLHPQCLKLLEVPSRCTVVTESEVVKMKTKNEGVAVDARRRAERCSLALREVMHIALQWGLSSAELAALLGISTRTLQHWKLSEKSGFGLRISPKAEMRLSYLIGINQALKIILPTASNRRLWLRGGNTGYPFAGESPLERMLRGEIADLAAVRESLDLAFG